MGKNGNNTKKGKQKAPTSEVPSAPPPPPSPPPLPVVSSPPAAHHIPYPPTAVDTIEEQEEFGHPSGGTLEVVEEEPWQDVGRPADDDWAADIAPENSSQDIGDSGWEPDAAQGHMPPFPPQPLSEQSGGGKDRTKPYYPQPQYQHPPSGPQGFAANAVGAHKPPATNWGHAKPQHPQDTWIPPNAEWGDNDEWGDPANDGDGWNHTNGGWGQQHSATWAHAVSTQSQARPKATSHAPTAGWQSWGEEARRLPKVTFDPAIPPSPSSSGIKAVLSQQQRSQILNALLNNPQQNQQPYPMHPNTGASAPPLTPEKWQKHPPAQHGSRPEQGPPHLYPQHHKPPSKDRKNKPPGQDQRVHRSEDDWDQDPEEHDVWGLGEGWSDGQDEDQHDADPWGRKVHFTPSTLRASMLPSSTPSVAPSAVVENFTVKALPQTKLGLSTIPMSKTLSYAYSGTTPSTESEPGRAAMQRITDFQFAESRGEALKDVKRAFYSKERKASDRFHWLFSSEKDERVRSLLHWIDCMSFGIASFGLQKFLQTRERGALFVNAAYRPVHSPSQYAFDWLSWNEIQRTMDQTLQVSVGYYNPTLYIIVFVFLPSHTGNSVAIWRRKLAIPDHIRLAYQAQITQALSALRKEYPVELDQYVPKHGKEWILTTSRSQPPPERAPPKKKKRKWYKLWLST